MRILIDKPNNNRIEKALGSFQDTSTTYNQSGYTYNQAGQVYGGFYGVSDEAPTNSFVAFAKPANSDVEVEKPT